MLKQVDTLEYADKSEVKRHKEEEAKTCEIRHSNFMFTVTINKARNKMSYDEFIKNYNLLKNAVEKFERLISEGEFLQVSELLPKYKIKPLPPDLFERIKEVRIESCIELAPESDFLHSHIGVFISKRGLDTKYDYKRIGEFFNREMGFSVYTHKKIFTDAHANLSAYIAKSKK